MQPFSVGKRQFDTPKNAYPIQETVRDHHSPSGNFEDHPALRRGQKPGVGAGWDLAEAHVKNCDRIIRVKSLVALLSIGQIDLVQGWNQTICRSQQCFCFETGTNGFVNTVDFTPGLRNNHDGRPLFRQTQVIFDQLPTWDDVLSAADWQGVAYPKQWDEKAKSGLLESLREINCHSLAAIVSELP